MRFEKIRSRIFLAMGFSGALITTASAVTGCGNSTTTPDARATSDAPKADANLSPDAPPSVRRPFLIGASLRASNAMTRSDWSSRLSANGADSQLDDKTRIALANVWRQDALEEHASIAAFSRFALHLLSVGAPPELIAAAQRAAVDEIRHARDAFALARRSGGAEVGPAPLRVDDALGALSLAEIAELTAEEGCVGETLGAILAAEQAGLASDATAHAILRRIARDESRHAELAWRFVRWAVDVGGADVLAAVTRGVRRACAGTVAAAIRIYDVDADAWHAHGRVSCEEARAIAVAGINDVIEPALAALSMVSRTNVPTMREHSFASLS